MLPEKPKHKTKPSKPRTLPESTEQNHQTPEQSHQTPAGSLKNKTMRTTEPRTLPVQKKVRGPELLLGSTWRRCHRDPCRKLSSRGRLHHGTTRDAGFRFGLGALTPFVPRPPLHCIQTRAAPAYISHHDHSHNRPRGPKIQVALA